MPFRFLPKCCGWAASFNYFMGLSVSGKWLGRNRGSSASPNKMSEGPACRQRKQRDFWFSWGVHVFLKSHGGIFETMCHLSKFLLARGRNFWGIWGKSEKGCERCDHGAEWQGAGWSHTSRLPDLHSSPP